MRVVLVGPPARLQRLRAALPDGLEAVGEAPTIGAARLLAAGADAFLVVTPVSTDDGLPVEALTHREVDVLALLADGLPNKAIAARLHISDETVKFHVAAIFGKLGASNRTAAVRKAIRRGLVPL